MLIDFVPLADLLSLSWMHFSQVQVCITATLIFLAYPPAFGDTGQKDEGRLLVTLCSCEQEVSLHSHKGSVAIVTNAAPVQCWKGSTNTWWAL